MRMAKFSTFFVLLLSGCFGSFWLGSKSGAYQMYLNSEAATSMYLLGYIRRLEKGDCEDGLNEIQADLNDTIIAFGKHVVESRPSTAWSQDYYDGTVGLFKRAVEYRVEHPRLYFGEVMSPYSREVQEQKTSATAQKNIEFYNAAFEYFGFENRASR